MMEYTLILPEDFYDYEWELEAKGYFSEAKLSLDGKIYRLSFYDPERLGQEIASELQRDASFFEPNLIVVQSITRESIQKSIVHLVKTGDIRRLTAE